MNFRAILETNYAPVTDLIMIAIEDDTEYDIKLDRSKKN